MSHLSGFMKVGPKGLAKQYPETVYPPHEQREIFEYDLSKLLASIDNPERAAEAEAHRREAFEAGKLLFVSRKAVGNALWEAEKRVTRRTVADYTWLESDDQSDKGWIGIARSKEKGWFAVPVDCMDFVQDETSPWRDR